MSTDMRMIIAQAIADALNDQLDDGYEPLGDGIDYDTLDISIQPDGVIVIDGMGPEFDAYKVEVKWL